MNNKIIGRFIPVNNFNRGYAPFNVITKEQSSYLPPSWEGIREDGETYHVAEFAWRFEPMKWDGDGFPLVGCECEYKDTGTGEWMPVEIKYSSSQIVVFSGRISFSDSAVELSKDVVIDKPQFRPIRSEAERKRDEAVKEFVRQLIECVDLHAMDNMQESIVREKLYSMLPTLPGVTVID